MNPPKFITNLIRRSMRKKLIPHIKTTNPIINELVDIAIKYHYDYDTIYKVYSEWDNNIEATESVFVSAFFMCVDPLEITQESMRRFGEVIRECMISMAELEAK